MTKRRRNDDEVWRGILALLGFVVVVFIIFAIFIEALGR